MQLQLYAKRILLYRKPIDFRRGLDGLGAMVASELKQSPKEVLCLFFNRKFDKLKMIFWHKNGFMMCYKRIEAGRFNLGVPMSMGTVELSSDEMGWLLAGLEWHKMRHWKELNYDKFS